MDRQMQAYSIVHSAADADRGCFPSPEILGTYLSKDQARVAMSLLILEEKRLLSPRYDTVEEDTDKWEAFQNGYAAALYSRFEIVPSQLHGDLGIGTMK